jgi:hypothetical protein
MESKSRFSALDASGVSRVVRSGALGLALLSGACQGEIGGVAGANGSNAGRVPGSSSDGDPGASTARPPLNPDGTKAPGLDVNRVAIHRLNNAEYDNTMHDLLGVTSTPATSFIEDEKLGGFDNIASAFGMTDAQYEQYFNAADALVEEAFTDASLRGRILTCTPTSNTDAACASKIITAFGARAWRRPLEATEVSRLQKVLTDAVALGEDFTGGVKQVVKSILSSTAFLYRTEVDADPASTVAHPVGGYEMASRLSYLFWSTMPDATLFAEAANGDLLDVKPLSAQIDRLLADGRSSQFLANFAGQWLGLRDLGNHQVEPSVFPDWSDALRRSMVQEGLLYFDEFLSGNRGMDEFFTADVNFVDPALAKLYGVAAPTNGKVERVINANDTRRGFLGLSSFLTMTSYSYRTAPTLRGKWVLENLLCQDVPPPPANVPKLDMSMDSTAAQSENVRVRLEAHRANPQCASCHKILDPIGLGLENFDAIGDYRTTYLNGDAIDASGMLPDGTAFNGLTELTDALSTDKRLTDCVSKKMMTYALSREVGDSDAPYLEQIRSQWTTDGLGLADLLKQIVLNDTFRYRRGEAK